MHAPAAYHYTKAAVRMRHNSCSHALVPAQTTACLPPEVSTLPNLPGGHLPGEIMLTLTLPPQLTTLPSPSASASHSAPPLAIPSQIASPNTVQLSSVDSLLPHAATPYTSLTMPNPSASTPLPHHHHTLHPHVLPHASHRTFLPFPLCQQLVFDGDLGLVKCFPIHQ